MARGIFRQFSAAIKAAIAAGREPSSAEIDPATGRIVLRFGRPQDDAASSLDQELSEWQARHG
jgi:hypothetical protein